MSEKGLAKGSATATDADASNEVLTLPEAIVSQIVVKIATKIMLTKTNKMQFELCLIALF